MRSRNVEAMATAALFTAIRQEKLPRTLPEMANVSGITRDELGKYLA
jgi:transcription initiation factor TFIIIB Brf1 subunit/transcription initiation factor TFIIB